MNIIADNNIYPEMIGGEAWFGKVADTLGQWYVSPDIRFQMIEKFDGFLQEAMSYRQIDRSQVSTRDLVLADGQAYREYQDPPLHDCPAHVERHPGLRAARCRLSQ